MADYDIQAGSAPTGPDMQPSWLAPLVELMGRTRNPPTVLPFAVVVDEVDMWRRHARDESWERRANRVSLFNDFRASVAAAGNHLAQAIGPVVRPYQRCLQQVATDRRVSADRFRELTDTGSALRAALATPAALLAAWRDVLAASQAPTADTESVTWALTCLEAMIESTERYPKQTLQDARAILDPDPRLARFNPDAPTARTPLDVRLRLAANVITALPVPQHCIAWITYGFARLSGARDFGTITFYEIDWAAFNALNDDGQAFPHRGELRSLLQQKHLRRPEKTQGRPYQVLARVDLGKRAPHHALDDADAMIQVLLRIAGSRSGGTAWQRVGSACLILDGQVALCADSAGPYVSGEVDHHGQNIMADALAEYGPSVAEGLSRTQMPPDLADALRLLCEASEVDSREVFLTGRSTIDRKTVLVLEDAAFEHIASYGRMSGDDLEEAILATWPHACWSRQVSAAINVCLRSDEVASTALYRRIITHSPGRTLTSFLEAGHLTGELLALCRNPLNQRFAEKWLSSIRDGALGLDLHQRQNDERDLLRERLSRTRNALTHGNPVHPAVIDSVRDLSTYRVNAAIGVALEVFSNSGSFDAVLRARTEGHGRVIDHLTSGVSMLDQWHASD